MLGNVFADLNFSVQQECYPDSLFQTSLLNAILKFSVAQRSCGSGRGGLEKGYPSVIANGFGQYL